jgi:cytidine deaminase
MQDISLLEAKDIELIERAKDHVKKMYQESRTSIAAVLLSTNGKVFTGVNLKYQTRSVSMCAGRVALFKALDEGETTFSTLVEVKYFPETDTFEIMNTCGECRQVFLYYKPFDAVVIDQGKAKKVSTGELLPYHYT